MSSSTSHWLPSRLAAGAILLSIIILAAAPTTWAQTSKPPSTIPTRAPATSLPAASGLPQFSYHEEHPLLAYYYVWWDPSVFAQSYFTPPQPYNSDDPSVMGNDLQQASAAGIDGFVVSWYGNGGRTENNFNQLLTLARPVGFKATIDFETAHFDDAHDVLAQLQAFYALHIQDPGLVQYQGRPAIFFWQASTYSNATWSSIRQQVDPSHQAVWLADGDDFAFQAGDAWDGISPYAIAWSPDPASQLPSWGAQATAATPSKLYVPPVSPGCDDSDERAVTCQQDRAGGAYYQAALQGALASNPPWAVIVTSFNE